MSVYGGESDIPFRNVNGLAKVPERPEADLAKREYDVISGRITLFLDTRMA